MTGPTLVVAPREITDLAFRASRVGGCDASVAERLAQDVTGCEVHRGCGLARLATLLSAGTLAATFRCTQRALLDAERNGCCVECPGVDGPLDGNADVEGVALAEGLVVDAEAWAEIGRVADGFVLSEAIIDAADTPIL